MIRSKWLDWQPGAETIGKTAEAQPTKPTKPSSVGFEGRSRQDFLITSDPSNRQSRVLAAINALVEPPGLSQWLTAERPDLMTRGRHLVLQIDAAWSAPLAEFELALERFVVHHTECCREFEACRTNSENTILESDQAPFERATKESVQPCSPRAQKPCRAQGHICPGCKGTWHTESDLAGHMGQCPRIGKPEEQR